MWLAQALAYKLGQLEILKLREETHAKLKAKFDLRGISRRDHRRWTLPLDI